MICSIFSEFKMKNAEKKLLAFLLFKAFVMVCVYFYYDSVLAVGTTFKSSSVNTHDKSPHYSQSADSTEGLTKCPDLRTPSLKMTSQTWIPVTERNTSYMYSAYYVKSQERNEVVITGAQSYVYREQNYICQLWYLNETSGAIESMVEKPSVVSRLPEGHGLQYSARLFSCPLSSDQIPLYVSMVDKSCKTPEGFLPIQINNKPEVKNRKFTICLAPIHNNFSDVHKLIEWIELNLILGADKFIIYNNTMAENVTEVLKYYYRKGIVEVHDWKPPMIDKIHYFGQVVALNDCLYRNKNISEFMVNLDLDEFIIPHSNHTNNWSDLLDQMNNSFDAFIFRNVFFPSDWNNTGPFNTLIDKYKLKTLQTIYRENKINRGGDRSKYMARTATVSDIMIHTVRSQQMKVVPTNVALLHHYRYTDSDEKKAVKVLDKTIANKFEKKLINNVQNVWTDLNW